MTRRHFELIARVVAQVDDAKARERLAWAFAHELAQTNDRFDCSRFVEACGVPLEV